MTSYHALKAVRGKEADYNKQLATERKEDTIGFIRNLKLFCKKCGYEVVNIVIRCKKTGEIYRK